MGVIPVNENDKGFNFDGESSKTFDLIITGGAIFDAPERDVELIEIPGRNGALVQDLGRFKNVTVTYQCALTSTKEHEFVDAMRKVREWLCSKRGYCRLWDDFNPGEYRLGMFKGYIEVTNEAPVVGRFDLSFDCMPQRFLLNGDNPVAVSDDGTIFNPTLFDSRPLLLVYGHGAIGINGDEVRVRDDEIGDLILVGETNGSSVTFPTDSINTGDTIAMMALTGAGVSGYNLRFGVDSNYPLVSVTGETTADTNGIVREFRAGKAGMHIVMYLALNDFDALYGTDKSAQATFTINVEYTNNGETVTATIQYRIIVEYSGDQFSMRFIRLEGGVGLLVNDDEGVFTCGKIYAYSTKSALGEPLYFDLDIGEAYKIEGGELISVNNAVTMPAELPVLKPGANTITLGPNITELDIVPRWWEV